MKQMISSPASAGSKYHHQQTSHIRKLGSYILLFYFSLFSPLANVKTGNTNFRLQAFNFITAVTTAK